MAPTVIERKDIQCDTFVTKKITLAVDLGPELTIRESKMNKQVDFG